MSQPKLLQRDSAVTKDSELLVNSGTVYNALKQGYDGNVHCSTVAGDANKIGTTELYTKDNNNYFTLILENTNTAAELLTLNINSAGSYPIYINGEISSSSNFILPKGVYMVYFDQTNYYFRTDGAIEGTTFTGMSYYTNEINCNNASDDVNYYLIGVPETNNGNKKPYIAYNSNGVKNTAGVYFNGSTGVLYGAAWNDYAEYRITREEIEPGRCVIENGDDTLSLSTERLQRGCEIVSDTFGFAIGETEESKTPIAATGRVLCYLLEGREKAKSYIGWPVCSGPNGTVSIMTEEEEEKYPSRIIGTISAVPDYEEWGSGNVKVNGRVWIRIK